RYFGDKHDDGGQEHPSKRRPQKAARSAGFVSPRARPSPQIQARNQRPPRVLARPVCQPPTTPSPHPCRSRASKQPHHSPAAAPAAPPPPPPNGGRASPARRAPRPRERRRRVPPGLRRRGEPGAESIARGVAASGVLPASAVRTAPHRRPERAAAFASLGATILASNAQVVDDSDVIVISVKPQIVKQVLVELKPLLSEEKLLVSIAAGIKMKDLQIGLVSAELLE
uniref:Pyrroline-5-carboxylate reductase catalytic N-terminal domain-containing protein n=1 Tax=Aegilops tauschii subsp. strangulata TaxID=200361 RepID=A0A453GMA9_AEGTS